MRLETFRAPDLLGVASRARDLLGDDAMIVHTRTLRTGDGTVIEVVAAAASEVEAFQRRLTPGPLFVPRRPLAPPPPQRLPRGRLRRTASSAAPRPYVLALVGPAGAGKTTTAAKLARQENAFGSYRVGYLSLAADAGEAGAPRTRPADALPAETAHDRATLEAALDRLDACEVVIVDTPPHSPALEARNARWRALLSAARPDETHLVLPASMRVDVALAMRETFDTYGITHLLLSKLDEVPGDAGVADLARHLDIPARWVADGELASGGLRAAAPRILASLGLLPAPVPA